MIWFSPDWTTQYRILIYDQGCSYNFLQKRKNSLVQLFTSWHSNMLLNLTLVCIYSHQSIQYITTPPQFWHHGVTIFSETATLDTHATSPPKKATGPPPRSLIFLWQVSKMESLGWPVVGSSTTAVVVMVAWLWCSAPGSDRSTPSVSIVRLSLRNWRPASQQPFIQCINTAHSYAQLKYCKLTVRNLDTRYSLTVRVALKGAVILLLKC